jgi:hypothetical protein
VLDVPPGTAAVRPSVRKTDGIIVLPHIGGPHPQRDKFVARLFVDNLPLPRRRAAERRSSRGVAESQLLILSARYY